jgi:polyketide biosynthesis acyl carrier protein
MSDALKKAEIFSIIKKHAINVLPGLEDKDICIEKSLKELGANSIDRMEIVVLSMESIKITSSLVELSEIKNLNGLVTFFYNKLKQKSQET